ncbi:hypothetical protein EV360DRAFT_88337 [Lentinula raphanica]|nr:hypothetical protein EV360DRAFT_88337 [Lentinula raphanica]
MSDLNSTVGALEIGNVIATYFFGIITLQTYFFFRTFPNDKPLIKTAVGVVFAFELGHTITSLHALYIVTVKDFGEPQLFAKLPNSIDVTLLFEGLITIVVQGFFITRMQRLAKIHRLVIHFLWICAILRFAASVALTVFGIQTPSATTYVADWSWLLTTLFSLGAFVDLGVALALCSYLYSQRATSIAKTGILLDRLIAFTLTTGLLTSIVSVVTVISVSPPFPKLARRYSRLTYIGTNHSYGLDFDVYVTREIVLQLHDGFVCKISYFCNYALSQVSRLNSRPALKSSAGSNVITLSTVIGGSLSNQINTGRLNNLQAPRSGGSDEDVGHSPDRSSFFSDHHFQKRTVNISQVVETRTDSDDIYTFTPKNGKMKLESDV